MQDSRRREIRIKADSFRVKCIISRYGIIDLGIQDFGEKGLSAMDIARILSEFNVSFDMALNRLESLGTIDLNQKLRLDNERTMKKVGNLLRSVGGNAKLNEPSNVIDIPYEYIDYVFYNYNHNAVPKERRIHEIKRRIYMSVRNCS